MKMVFKGGPLDGSTVQVGAVTLPSTYYVPEYPFFNLVTRESSVYKKHVYKRTVCTDSVECQDIYVYDGFI